MVRTIARVLFYEYSPYPPTPPWPPLLSNTTVTADTDCQLIVVCFNSGHLRPEPGASLCFLMGLFSVPQTKEPTVARAIPTPRNLHGPIGSIGTKIW